jgi:adsorption protein B
LCARRWPAKCLARSWGTCASRCAILAMLEEGDAIAFNVQSLTEDYDIGFQLKTRGMTEVFVRMPAEAPAGREAAPVPVVGRSLREAGIVSMRGYFPDTFATAVQQKSRWIIGIVYQGFHTHRWTSSGIMNYFLWRDSKGVVTYFVSFMATQLALQLVLVWAYQTLMPDSYKFLSIFEGDRLLTLILSTNLALIGNRIVQRVIFVTSYSGIIQGLLSVPRFLCGNWRSTRACRCTCLTVPITCRTPW